LIARQAAGVNAKKSAEVEHRSEERLQGGCVDDARARFDVAIGRGDTDAKELLASFSVEVRGSVGLWSEYVAAVSAECDRQAARRRGQK